MKTEIIIRKFTENLTTELQDPLARTDCAAVLEVLYNALSECNAIDNIDIRNQFAQLFERLNDRSLQETDELINAVCDLCRAHEKSGFEAGIKVGIRLAAEIRDE